MLLSALVHESGHLIAIKLLCKKKITFTLYPFGADIAYDGTNLSYANEICIALSGSAANILLSVLSIAVLEKVYSRELMFFMCANLVYAVINLFPIKTLDGGKALENTLLCFFGVDTAIKIAEFVSGTAFMLLTYFALCVLNATGYNFSLLMMCLYLFISVYIKENLNFNK